MLIESIEEKQRRQERESKQIGVIATLVLHAALLVFLWVTLAWTPPDPPIPRYGIEVDLGVGFEGSGNVENATDPNESESLEKASPNPNTSKPTTPVNTPKPAENKPVTESKPDIVPVHDNDDGVVGGEKPKPAEQPKKDNPGPAKSDADNTGKSDTDLANNQGKGDKIGDAGQKDGNINADAVLGGGKGGGAHLSLDGWYWDEAPDVSKGPSETGTVTIQFKINSDGDVVSAKVGGGTTVSPSTAEFYRSYVETQMAFSPKGTTGKVPSFTLGSITFVIKSK